MPPRKGIADFLQEVLCNLTDCLHFVHIYGHRIYVFYVFCSIHVAKVYFFNDNSKLNKSIELYKMIDNSCSFQILDSEKEMGNALY